MPPRFTRFFRYPWRAVTALTLLAIIPKCVLCVTAYLGLGALLGMGPPEICGAPTGSGASWTTMIAVSGLIGAFGAACLLFVGRLGRFWRRTEGLIARQARAVADSSTRKKFLNLSAKAGYVR
jgi:hypothetical protein